MNMRPVVTVLWYLNVLPAAALVYGGFRLRKKAAWCFPVCALLGVAGILSAIGFVRALYPVLMIVGMLAFACNLPADRKLPVSRGLFLVFWVVELFFLVLFTQAEYQGVEINMAGLFTKVSLSSDFAKDLLAFLVLVAVGFAAGLVLRGRWCFLAEAVVTLLAYWKIYMLLVTTMSYGIQREGLVLEALAAVVGMVLLAVNVLRVAGSAARLEAEAGICDREEMDETSEGVGVNEADEGEAVTEIPAQKELRRAEAIKTRPAPLRQAGVQPAPAKSEPTKPAPSTGLRLRCLSGEYAGVELELLPEHQIGMGTNPTKCNLIFSAAEVSGLHCVIFCPQEAGAVTILDYSRNGTYFADGTRLPKEKSNSYRLPCTIRFGRTPESFEISQK